MPVVAYLGLVGRSYVFDLHKGGSLVEMLMEHGFDVYVLDWGTTDELDVGHTLETYLGEFLPPALDAVCARSGSPDLNVLAYCTGAVLTVHATAAQPDLPVHGLVTLAAPFDRSDLGTCVDAVRDGRIGLDDLVDDTGNIPAATIVESFEIRRPTSDLVNYANLWQHLWDDRYVEAYQAAGRFLRDHVPLARGAAEQMLQQWMRDNAFVTDRLRWYGRPVSLASVRIPVLGVIAERDDIAPVESARAITRALPNADVEVLEIDTGHVGLFAGRPAVEVVMPRVFAWLAAHAEETHERDGA